MALVVDAVDPAIPQIHALVIGVGQYDHLPGGNGAQLPNDFGMQQLTTSEPSAREFVEWLKKINHPTAKLGSIEMLVSPSFASVETDTASVVRACSDWFLRCNQHKDSVAVFFFCGHGVMRTRAALLLSDFGVNPLNPFANALDFEKLVWGMGRCAAQTQVYFVDACRQMPWPLLDQVDLEAAVPIPPLTKAPQNADYAIVRSAAPLEVAYGTAAQPSRFTRALIRALNGSAAGMDATGRWQIQTDKIFMAVKSELALLCRQEQAPSQSPRNDYSSPRGAIVHQLAADPQVSLSVSVTPAAARNDTEVGVHKGNTLIHKWPPALTEQLIVALPPGEYALHAQSPTLGTGTRRVFLIPPGTDQTIEVSA